MSTTKTYTSHHLSYRDDMLVDSMTTSTRATDESQPGTYDMAATALAEIMDWIFIDGHSRTVKGQGNGVLSRMLAASICMGRLGMTAKDAAEKHGVNYAKLRLNIVEFKDGFGFRKDTRGRKGK